MAAIGRRDLVLSVAGAFSHGEPGDAVGWGIVGLGDVCAVKAGPAFVKAEGSALVAVMRRTPGAAEVWAKRNVPGGNCRGYSDLDAFLADPAVDAVYICTPPGSHLEIARKVAAARKPCYIEKPMGRSATEAEQIVSVFEQHNLPLFSAYTSRAFERTAAVRRLLATGAVGAKVTHITYICRGPGLVRGLQPTSGGSNAEENEPLLPWRLVASQSGGGLVMDVGCHLLDRLDFLCGPLVKVRGKAANRASPDQKVEDWVELEAEISACSWAAIESAGATVRCTWDFSAAEAADELVIAGPSGALRMAGMSPAAPVTVVGPAGETLQELTFDAPVHVAQPLIQGITDQLRGVGTARAASTGANALRTARVLDAALEAYYGGRRDAFWDRPDSWPGIQVSSLDQKPSPRPP